MFGRALPSRVSCIRFGQATLLVPILLISAAAAEPADYAIVLTKTQVRTEAGFGKPSLQNIQYLDVFRVKGSALGEGRQPWYEIVLREHSMPRTILKRGWVIRLPGEGDPLLRDEAAVFRHPGDRDPPQLVKTRWLSRTGIVRHDGAWTEVTWNVRLDRVDALTGFVPANDIHLEVRSTMEKISAKLDVVRANPQWTPLTVGAILRGDIREGFSREAVLLAVGEPEIRAETEGHKERWLYRHTSVGPLEVRLFRGFVESVRKIDEPSFQTAPAR